MSVRSLLFASTLAFASLMASSGAADAAPAATLARTVEGPYVDMWSYLRTDAQIDAWYTLTRQLRHNFDDICGDTFCEGDYSNIESLRYLCSVNSTTGRMGQCVWVFAGSYEDVEPATGKVAVQSQVWRCRTPLVPGTTVDGFLAALAGDEPLYAALPQTDRTIYDGLIDCL